MTYTNGTHVAEAEVDSVSGAVRISATSWFTIAAA